MEFLPVKVYVVGKFFAKKTRKKWSAGGDFFYFIPNNEVVFDTKNNFYPPIKRYKMNFETVSYPPFKKGRNK